MQRKGYIVLFVSLFAGLFPVLKAQETANADKLIVTGSVQSEMLVPQSDSIIGTGTYDAFLLSNSYVNLNVAYKNLSAGTRFEYKQFPLPGYENDFKGWGFPNIFVKGEFKNLKVTLGDFYDQFGNGLLLKTYEERTLGIDNSLRGLDMQYNPFKGLHVKVLGGKQRYYFQSTDSWVWGADAELNLEELHQKWRDKNVFWSVGVSYVGKYEKEDTILVTPQYRLQLPEKVGALAARSRLQLGNYAFMSEFAIKSNDPTKSNGYIYKNGNVLLLSGSYSEKGLSVLVQAKRNDNMDFRSVRTQSGLSSTINNLPPFAMQHTYALAALHPYGTQPNGEWAFQSQVEYTLKKKTLLGGKYGTHLKLNMSHIRAIDQQSLVADGTSAMGTDGYTSSFFKIGDVLYYQDINMGIEKKINSSISTNLMYMHQIYNQFVVEAHGETIYSNIFITDTKVKLNTKLILRTELQYLHSLQSDKDWLFGLIEMSVYPSLLVSVSDMYNVGETNIHYYNASVSYNYQAHRLQIGYGRTRAGYNCSGGVCRYVPASKGLQISYLYNF